MPQISQLAATYASQIFWLVVTFGAVFLVVGRGMLPQVQETMIGRDQRIGDDLAAAKAARVAADAAEAEWHGRDHANRERAQALVAEARARAARATEQTLAKASTEHGAQLAARENDIRAAAARASAEIEQVAADLARSIADRVAGVQVSAEEAAQAVRGTVRA